MGLKTTNYISKSTNISLPEAYAIIKNLDLNDDNRVEVTFAIQADRESADKYDPVDEAKISFTWDRKADMAKMAYETAKTKSRKVSKRDRETGKITTEETNILYGWEDDIVE